VFSFSRWSPALIGRGHVIVARWELS